MTVLGWMCTVGLLVAVGALVAVLVAAGRQSDSGLGSVSDRTVDRLERREGGRG